MRKGKRGKLRMTAGRPLFEGTSDIRDIPLSMEDVRERKLG